MEPFNIRIEIRDEVGIKIIVKGWKERKERKEGKKINIFEKSGRKNRIIQEILETKIKK